MTVEPDLYRASISRVPLPIAVVTAVTSIGRTVGFTASSVCSLSASPPALLISVDHATRSSGALRESDEFAVDFLSTEHRELARAFATRGHDKFDSPHVTTDDDGHPGIANAIVHMRCRVEHRFDIYDHLVVVGSIAAVAASDGRPLLMANRSFTTPSEDRRWPFDGSAPSAAGE